MRPNGRRAAAGAPPVQSESRLGLVVILAAVPLLEELVEEVGVRLRLGVAARLDGVDLGDEGVALGQLMALEAEYVSGGTAEDS